MLLFLVLGLSFFTSLFSCTSFQISSQDGAKIYCRSLEFGFPLQSELLIVPRSSVYTGTAPDNHLGLQWKTKHGFVGMNQSAAPNLVNDGMNEKGLVVGCLYLPGYAQYEAVKPEQYETTLGAWELTTYLLSTCSTIQDVQNAILKIIVSQQGTPQLNGFILPLHFIVSDATGASIVIEYVNGERKVFDNPIGVLTNSPPFDWQMIHLMNYENLSPANVSGLQLRNFKVPFYGQGSGLMGLPGDFSPSSRFVRAALYSSFAASPKTALHAVRLGFHILNTFDVFEGIIRTGTLEEKKGKVPPGMSHSDITQWIVVHDQTNRKTYFRTYDSLSIQMVDLKKIDFQEEGFRQIAMRKDFIYEDVTDNARLLTIKSDVSK